MKKLRIFRIFKSKGDRVILAFIVLVIAGMVAAGSGRLLYFIASRIVAAEDRVAARAMADHSGIPVLSPGPVLVHQPGPIPERRLGDIRLIRQQFGNSFHGAAAVYMTENYFFGESSFADVCYFSGESGSFDYLFELANEVAPLSPTVNRRTNSYFLMTRHLENRGLNASLLIFRDLGEILPYLQENQIPAIFSIMSENWRVRNSVVFTGYDPANELIFILDPQNQNRNSITLSRLKSDFLEVPWAAGSANTMIITSDRIHTETSFFCPNCNHKLVIDGLILGSVSLLGCPNCGRFSSLP